MSMAVMNSLYLQARLVLKLVLFSGAVAFVSPRALQEPFRDLHDFCSNCNPPIPESPDPLVSYTWNATNDFAEPQLFRVTTDQYEFTPPNCGRFVDDTSSIIVSSLPCSIRCDWLVEQAGWLEVSVEDSTAQKNITIIGSLSEFNVPYPGKTRRMTYYPSTTPDVPDIYRLETNTELYEGIRYTWIDLRNSDEDSLALPFSLSHLTLVTKIKPLDYIGSYRSDNPDLTRAWYTAVYSVRLNTEQKRFNSVLVERGDRVAIQGDGHPTIATALIAFRLKDLVYNVLNETNSAGNRTVVDDTIMAYPLYWCGSVLEWWRATGDKEAMLVLVHDVMWILDRRIDDFLDPNLDLVWMGWDDRLGNGWCGHAAADDCGAEAHQVLASLAVRLCNDVCQTLGELGLDEEAKHYCGTAESLTKRFRRTFMAGLQGERLNGVHAVAGAINAGIVDSSEMTTMVIEFLNDPVSICSESPFNQYWILQALGNIPDMERALASIQMCWIPMFEVTTGCFWENFVPDWSRFLKQGDIAPGLQSACHPWASGVAAWQTHVHAGLEALQPGYSAVIATPYVSETHPTVKASVPTPWGKASVNATWDQSQSTVLIHIDTRRPGFVGVYRRVGLNKCDLHLETRVNGRVVQAYSVDSPELINVPLSTELRQHFSKSKSKALLFLPINGSASVVVSYANCPDSQDGIKTALTDIQVQPSFFPFGPAHYVASTHIDRKSQGDGLFHYGKDGYVLLGFDNATDRELLPEYVETCGLWRHGYPGGWKLLNDREFLGSSNSSRSFLPDPSQLSTTRALGTFGYDTPAGGQFHNVNINIKLTSPRPFCVSLYFGAKDATDKHVIRSMDLHSKKVIAPSSFIYDYVSGVWWSLCYNNSLRIRLQDMKGVHVSAIAFSGSINLPKTFPVDKS